MGMVRASYGCFLNFHLYLDLFRFLNPKIPFPGFSVRFPPLLRSGSLIFKSTRYREWYSERLRSWKDYIPVNYDTSDLGDKLEWVSKQDPDVITRIVQHGKDTAQRHIRPEDMQCYMYRLILEYATLFDPQSIG